MEESESPSNKRRSRSSSVASDSDSSTSSSSSSRIVLRPSSSPSDELFPYCVLNAIPEHTEVEHALYDLLEAMTDEPDFVLDQAQFGFLLGYTTYCLVVGNGCKQNVISRMTLADFQNARVDEPSGLHYFQFSSKFSCSQKDTVEYLCADERIWRALEIFEVARERRAEQAEWKGMEQPDSPFFCSFVSQNFILKDTNYPMSIFLRMCGIPDFPCRSSAICSSAWSLVKRDKAKVAHLQYAITYFRMLREKSRGQWELLKGPHPTYSKITSVRIEKARREQKEKVRKKQKRYRSPERRGVPNKPRGGDHRSVEFRRRTGREVEGEKEKKKVKTEDVDSEDVKDPEDVEDSEDVEDPEEVQDPEDIQDSEDSEASSLMDWTPPTPEYRIEKVEGDRTMTCL